MVAVLIGVCVPLFNVNGGGWPMARQWRPGLWARAAAQSLIIATASGLVANLLAFAFRAGWSLRWAASAHHRWPSADGGRRGHASLAGPAAAACSRCPVTPSIRHLIQPLIAWGMAHGSSSTTRHGAAGLRCCWRLLPWRRAWVTTAPCGCHVVHRGQPAICTGIFAMKTHHRPTALARPSGSAGSGRRTWLRPKACHPASQRGHRRVGRFARAFRTPPTRSAGRYACTGLECDQRRRRQHLRPGAPGNLPALQQHQPALVIVSIGGNDFCGACRSNHAHQPPAALASNGVPAVQVLLVAVPGLLSLA